MSKNLKKELEKEYETIHAEGLVEGIRNTIKLLSEMTVGGTPYESAIHNYCKPITKKYDDESLQEYYEKAYYDGVLFVTGGTREVLDRVDANVLTARCDRDLKKKRAQKEFLLRVLKGEV